MEQEVEVLRQATAYRSQAHSPRKGSTGPTIMLFDGIPVTVTCRVLKFARQPYYRWLRQPISGAELAEAYRAHALFDAHRDDPEFGHRLLADEAMADWIAWRIASENG